MIREVNDLMDSHWKWLRDSTAIRSLDSGWVEITTPYLDRHNDMLQIYASRDDRGLLLTDDGDTLHDLEICGCKLVTPKRQSLLQQTLAGFGVELRDGAIEVRTSSENFALRKHSLIQAMLAVNDLFFLSVSNVSSLFLEDVQTWLDTEEIRYTPKVKLSGKSGFDHLFEFVIPKSKTRPERLLHAINSPSRDTAELITFKWMDTKDVRPPNSQAYAILNDSEHSVSQGIQDALRRYEIQPVLWSKRSEYREALVA